MEQTKVDRLLLSLLRGLQGVQVAKQATRSLVEENCPQLSNTPLFSNVWNRARQAGHDANENFLSDCDVINKLRFKIAESP